MSTAAITAPPVPRLTTRQHLLLVLVFFVALGLRGAYLWGQAEHNPMYHDLIMDPAVHHTWACQIAAGEGMAPRPYFRAPLYYYLLAGLYKIMGPNPTAARIAGCIGGALTCYIIAHLGVLLASFSAGLLAGLIAAFYWPFIYFDADLLTVGLEVLLDVGFLYLLLRAARRDSPLLFLLGGVTFGLSVITRPNVLAFAPFIVLWLWIAARDKRPQPLRWLRATLFVAIGATLPIFPVTVRNYVVGHEFVLVATNGGVNFYIGNNPKSDGYSAIVPGTRASWEGGYIDTHRIPQEELGRPLTESEISDYWFKKGFDWICAAPLSWADLMRRKLAIFWSPIEMPNDYPIWFMARLSPISVLFWLGFPVVTCLGIAGMTLLWPQWRTWFLPVSFLFVYMLTVVAFFVCGRYRLPIVPVLILCAAAGLIRAVERVRARAPQALRPYVAAAGLSAAGLIIISPNLTSFNTYCDGTGHYILAVHYAQPEHGRAPDRAKAIHHYRLALQLVPEDPRTMRNLAWLLATAPEAELRDGNEALRLLDAAEVALKAGWPPVELLDPRAAAYAELGRFDEAVETAREALRQAQGPNSDVAPEQVAARLQLYEQGQPYREPS